MEFSFWLIFDLRIPHISKLNNPCLCTYRLPDAQATSFITQADRTALFASLLMTPLCAVHGGLPDPLFFTQQAEMCSERSNPKTKFKTDNHLCFDVERRNQKVGRAG
ncbi:Uncharacterised protein [Yersinia nurmii]|uniref:Uncharacterized protein n=1 Tax=Yersinia nurmii TaxID=685706 RepID=A0ABM9S3N4_9GAMM|nr:Uncharacterised protein [Yersinia nurmii]